MKNREQWLVMRYIVINANTAYWTVVNRIFISVASFDSGRLKCLKQPKHYFYLIAAKQVHLRLTSVMLGSQLCHCN